MAQLKAFIEGRSPVTFVDLFAGAGGITSAPATVREEDKVTVYEAISDLDFIGNGEVCTHYGKPTRQPKYEGLLRRRKVDGEIHEDGMTFAEWSKVGRLNHPMTSKNNPKGRSTRRW